MKTLLKLTVGACSLMTSVAIAGGHYAYPKVAPDLLNEGSSIHYLSDLGEVHTTAESMFKGKARKMKGLFKKIKTSISSDSTTWGSYAGGPYLITEPNGDQWRSFFTKTKDSKNPTCFFLFRREGAFAPEADGSRLIIGPKMEASVITPIDCATVDQVNRSAIIPGFEDFKPLSDEGRAQILRLNGKWSAKKHFDYIETAQNPEYPSSNPFERTVSLSYSASLDIHFDKDLSTAIFKGEFKNQIDGIGSWGNRKSNLAGELIPYMYRERINEKGQRVVLLWVTPMIPMPTDTIGIIYIPEKIVRAKTVGELLPLNDEGKCYVYTKECNAFSISADSLASTGGDVLVFSDVTFDEGKSFEVEGFEFKGRTSNGKLRVVNSN